MVVSILNESWAVPTAPSQSAKGLQMTIYFSHSYLDLLSSSKCDKAEWLSSFQSDVHELTFCMLSVLSLDWYGGEAERLVSPFDVGKEHAKTQMLPNNMREEV